jgi:thiamine pyrophosphokinase
VKKAFVFLNGNAPTDELISLAKTGDFTVCADGAYRYIEGKITPDLLVGDYDSLGYFPSPTAAKEILSFPVEKDCTDGSLAIKAAAQKGAKEIVILGALGGRADHFYANLSLLYLAKTLGIKAEILDENCKIFLLNGEIKLSAKEKSIVSLVPFFDNSHILKTKGLKYPADGITLTKLNSDLGVSNVALSDEIEIVTEGETLVFITKTGE